MTAAYRTWSLVLMNLDESIAAEAFGLVHGDRAAAYGHPREDFAIIAGIWTSLLHDVLRPGAEVDPRRVLVMMTGLKLARLVHNPDHHDSRVDVNGYMLCLERLDEPEEEDIPVARPAMQVLLMGFNDEREKLRQAREWLYEAPTDSEHWRASWEHVTHVLTYTSDPQLRTEAQALADTVLAKGFRQDAPLPGE